MKPIQSHIIGNTITSSSAEAFSLYEKSSFGEKVSGKIQYSLSETLFLVEKEKMSVLSGKKELSKDDLIGKFKRVDKKIEIKYPVFRDLRERGYVVKTALKFGAEFRVYDKGAKPGTKHAKWIVFTEQESRSSQWHEFSAKNRVAHSTKKKLLLAILDEEGDITYYEVKWIRP
jgi:tRNA-intron endonuclease